MMRLLVSCLFLVTAGLALAGDYGWRPGWLASLGGEPAKGAGKSAAASAKGAKSAPPAPVTAAVAMATDMPILLSAPGSVEPMASVAIKSRVDGQIVEVAFKEGDLVQAGQILFRLDDRLVLAQIRQADAAIARDEANLKDASGTLERRETLVQKKIVSEAITDTARAAVEVLKASIIAGKAQLEMQRTQLDYLTIRAPITGRTGSLSAKLGANIRAADPSALVTINQTQPIAVTFAVPQAELGALRRALAGAATARISADGVNPIKAAGVMSMIDNQVDKQTGTLTAKLTVPNLDEALWPGLAVDVELTVEVRRNIISVPASAVLPGQQGMLVWVIGADSKVAPKVVTLARIVGQIAYVSHGLAAGERVVTDGHIRIAPGATVNIRELGAPTGAPAKGTGGKAAPSGNGKSAPVENGKATPAESGKPGGPKAEAATAGGKT